VPGFYSESQKLNFRTANERVRRGGPEAKACGARTRTGNACRQVPVKGSSRCLRHCGPKAAREYRERQRQEFLSGKLSHEDWTRAEARREANRLRERWKKDPWVPGSTIDLGEHERTFQQESGLVAPGRANPVPPAVLDWLRWRFRRLRIDRQRDREWLRVLHEELPQRLLAARPAPVDATVRQGQERAAAAMKWRAAPPEQSSKRFGLDRPSAPASVKPRSLRGPGRPRKNPLPDAAADEQQELALFVHQYRDVLAPMFERCRTDEQAAIIEALRAFVADPNDRAARDRWMRVVMSLQVL
jgi:hypothetical protein